MRLERLKLLVVSLALLVVVLFLIHSSMLVRFRPKPHNLSKHSNSSQDTAATHTCTLKGNRSRVATAEATEFANSLQFHPSSFKIALLCSSRAKYLNKTLNSLESVLFFQHSNLVLLQYGDSAQVAEIANAHGLTMFKNSIRPNLRFPSQHIASHYRWSLTKMFDMFPDIPHIIIIEDDMLFSPDFLLYFAQLAPLLHNDSTLYAISAFNDNGFKGLVRDNSAVHRSDFFAGLGWLLSRQLYKEELERIWPGDHWDHWLRHNLRRRNRQCLFPEISRTFHSGYLGSHSSSDLYDQYFRDIQLNVEPFVRLGIHGSLDYLDLSKYEQHFFSMMNDPDTVFINSLEELNSVSEKNVVISYKSQNSDPSLDRAWEDVAMHFEIWHSVPARCQFRGVVRLWWDTNQLFIVSSFSPFFSKLKESHPRLVDIENAKFLPTGWPVLQWSRPKAPPIFTLVTSEDNQSCTSACIQHGEQCAASYMRFINNCQTLAHHFSCSGKCRSATELYWPGFSTSTSACIINNVQSPWRSVSRCQDSQPNTRRLCPCLSEQRYQIYEREWDTFQQQQDSGRCASSRDDARN